MKECNIKSKKCPKIVARGFSMRRIFNTPMVRIIQHKDEQPKKKKKKSMKFPFVGIFLNSEILIHIKFHVHLCECK
jgi:hypothetical protein